MVDVKLLNEKTYEKDLDDFLRTWSEKTYKGKKFDEIFLIDEIPLWWFFRRFFVPHVMPNPINTFEHIYNRNKLNTVKKIKFSLASEMMKHYILFNEKRKIKYLRNGGYKLNEKSTSKCVFLSYSTHLSSKGEIFRLKNLINKLSKDGIDHLTLFADSLSNKNYSKLSGYTNIYQYYDSNISDLAKLLSTEAYTKWTNISQNTKNSLLTLPVQNISLWPFLKYPFNFFLSKEFLYILFLYYESCKKFIDVENAKVIVLTSQSGFFEKCLLAAAHVKNIPVIQIQHGVGSGNVDMTYHTKRLVFSDFHKQELIVSGAMESDITVIGPLIFDNLKRIKERANLENKSWFQNSSSQSYCVLLATSPFVEEGFLTKEFYFGIIRRILETIKSLNQAIVKIKLHPREKNAEEYQKIIDELGFSKETLVQTSTREEFYQLISECNSFVNFGSTAAIEAFILDKPVVNVDVGDFQYKNFTCDIVRNSDAAIKIRHDGDIKEAIVKSINCPELAEKRISFLKKYCYKVDGKAYERAAEFISSYVK